VEQEVKKQDLELTKNVEKQQNIETVEVIGKMSELSRKKHGGRDANHNAHHQ